MNSLYLYIYFCLIPLIYFGILIKELITTIRDGILSGTIRWGPSLRCVAGVPSPGPCVCVSVGISAAPVCASLADMENSPISKLRSSIQACKQRLMMERSAISYIKVPTTIVKKHLNKAAFTWIGLSAKYTKRRHWQVHAFLCQAMLTSYMSGSDFGRPNNQKRLVCGYSDM